MIDWLKDEGWMVLAFAVFVIGAVVAGCYIKPKPIVCVCECKAPEAQLQLGGKAMVYDDLIPDPRLLPDGAVIDLINPEPECGEPVKCPICSKTFRRCNHTTTCAVNHLPGSCCHYGDLEVSP
jgi:hypothetical protein